MDAGYPLTGVVALLTAVAFFLAAWGYGRTALRRVPLPATSPRPLVEVAIGAGLLGYVAFALGLGGLLRSWTLSLVLVGGVAILIAAGGRAPPPRWRFPVGTDRWYAAAAAAACGFALLGALLPEVEYDALWYHLTFPARYLQAGRLIDMPWEHMSPTPQHVELLYSYGLILGDARAAKLIHAGFGVLTVVWAAHLARVLVGPRWGWLTAALIVTAPTFTWEMTTAYNELPLAMYGTGAVAMLLAWRSDGGRSWLILAGCLLGFGLAGKHLAFFFLAPLAIGVLLVRAAGPRRTAAGRITDAALLCMVAVLVALPWYVRAWVYTGNPLFPMFYGVLTALGVEVQRWDAGSEAGWADAMGRYGFGRSLLDLVLVPWRATWHSAPFAGSLGPAWLLFLPLLPLTWHRLTSELRLLAGFCLAYFLLWVSPYSSFQIRYLVPLVPIAALIVAAAVRNVGQALAGAGYPRARRPLAVGVAAMLILNLPIFFPLHDARSGWISTTIHSVRPAAWATVAGLYDADRYIAARVPSYPAVQFMNEALPPGARVVWFSEAAHFYSRQQLVHDYSRSVAAGTWGAVPGEEEEAQRALHEAGVEYIVWDKVRKDVTEEMFAVRSPDFRERFTVPVYSDERVDVDRLLPPRVVP